MRESNLRSKNSSKCLSNPWWHCYSSWDNSVFFSTPKKWIKKSWQYDWMQFDKWNSYQMFVESPRLCRHYYSRDVCVLGPVSSSLFSEGRLLLLFLLLSWLGGVFLLSFLLLPQTAGGKKEEDQWRVAESKEEKWARGIKFTDFPHNSKPKVT